jgi:hypothetical protein
MKRKTISLSAIFAVFTFTSLAQLKVDQYGRIGMGTNYPNPEFKCHIAGNLLLSSYPSNPFYELRMKVNNGWPGVEIGSNQDKIAFWSPYVDYNDIYAANFYKMSDLRMKSNISNITTGLKMINQIRPVYYTIINNEFDSTGRKIENTRQQYGFISQEIEKSFPEVKITDDVLGFKLLDYDQIIPITVSAIQEQQKIIDSLIRDLAKFKEQLNSNRSLIGLASDNTSNFANLSTLSQNSPNPFNESTDIKFSINKENFRNASIIIFDMNGLLIKKFDIQTHGNGTIKINGNELKPGMYIYTLIVNDKEIDSKRMILLD